MAAVRISPLIKMQKRWIVKYLFTKDLPRISIPQRHRGRFRQFEQIGMDILSSFLHSIGETETFER
jgi:histidyl-tRNA synthetase